MHNQHRIHEYMEDSAKQHIVGSTSWGTDRMSSDPEIRDPRGEALAYLEQHKLLRLFNILGAKLACEKPEDPNAFLLAELSKAAVMSSRGQPV